jgi:hypothetical protein
VDAAPVARASAGLLVLPYLGLHSFQESSADLLDPGLRVGLLLGRHISGKFSMSAELTYDRGNWSVPAGAGDASSYMLQVSYSPLFHTASGQAEFVIGPKVGAWMLSLAGNDTFSSFDGSAEGWALGGNMGLFVPISPEALGGLLLSFDVRGTMHACSALAGSPQSCRSGGPDHDVLGFVFALIF